MTYVEFIKEYKLRFPPFNQSIRTGDILSITQNYFIQLKDLVSRMDESEFITSNKNDVLFALSDQCNTIIEALNFFYQGRVSEFHSVIYNSFFCSTSRPKSIYYKNIPSGLVLYRGRSTEQSFLRFQPMEMFHIPFEDISKTGNQRFSVHGFPSLYAGKTCYVCWEELDQIPLDVANFCSLETKRPVKMFDITPGFKILDAQEILRFPLFLACSISFTSKQSPHKSEYLIPQALLHALIQYNSVDCEINPQLPKFDGIIYLSTVTHKCVGKRDIEDLFNYVFPVKKINPIGLCENLTGLFTVSEPRDIYTIRHMFESEKVDLIKKMVSESINNPSYKQPKEDLKFELLEYVLNSKYTPKYEISENGSIL